LCAFSNYGVLCFFFFSSRRRHTRSKRDWSSDVCSSDLHHYVQYDKYVYTDHIARSGVALSKIAHKKVDLKNFRKSFYHLAPAGRDRKSVVVKKNNIRFPEMIYGEDLQFFAEVFFNTKNISTTHDVV